MSGFGTIANNLNAVNPLLSHKKILNSKKHLCWKCQTEQHTKDGKIKVMPGLFMFVCKTCLGKND